MNICVNVAICNKCSKMNMNEEYDKHDKVKI